MATRQIRILLADDHKITRQGLKSLLDNQPDMQVVAEAENGRLAVQLAVKLSPDIVVMDVSMPDLNGMEATRQIVSGRSQAKVVALSMHSDELYVTEMLKNGASGYLLKDCAFEELANAIRAIMDGKTYLSPDVSNVVVSGYLGKMVGNDSPASQILTDREREVLQLMTEGKSTKQIALKLHISVKTVETHRRQMMHKLDIYSVAELTKYAIRKGLTSLET